MNTQNALIESTYLGQDDGRITFWLTLKHGSSVQSFGGVALQNVKFQKLMDLMNIIGVTKWEDLKGKLVRVTGTSARLTQIGHISEDKWFDLECDLI
jgi:hypothetical protein